MTIHDIAVIGGGVAGAAIAARLAGAGRGVVLLEKEKGPHNKVCGEFISHEGADYLARLGVHIAELGSLPIRGVRLARCGAAVRAPLPFEAQSLSRRLLDEALLRQASNAGAEIRRGTFAKGLAKNSDFWTIALDDGDALHAKEVFLATGKHDLRGWKRPPGVQPDLIALKAYWRLAPKQLAELEEHVELILFPGGYAGLQPVENGRANLCLLVRKSAFAARYGSWHGLLNAMQEYSPHLRARLNGAECLFEKPLAIARLPYGYVARQGDGVWRLGDQAAVIPSFSGDGMSIALHSAHRAAQSYLRGDNAAAYQRRLALDLGDQVRRATALSQMLARTAGQQLAMALSGFSPAVLALGARLTRIPSRALRSRLAHKPSLQAEQFD